MLQKKHRLSGKDIQYILRRGGKIYGKIFIFRVIPQYKQHNYMQWSIQIPIKLDKRASMRNLLKRQAKHCFVELLQMQHVPLCKVFIFVNKQAVDGWKDTIATQEKTRIVEERYKSCKDDFTFFLTRVGAVLQTSSQSGFQKPRISGTPGGKNKKNLHTKRS